MTVPIPEPDTEKARNDVLEEVVRAIRKEKRRRVREHVADFSYNMMHDYEVIDIVKGLKR